MYPSINNGFIRSPGKAPGPGGSSRLGEGGWDPWKDNCSWKTLQRQPASAPWYSWVNKPSGLELTPRAHSPSLVEPSTCHSSCVSKDSDEFRNDCAVIKSGKWSHRTGQHLTQHPKKTRSRIRTETGFSDSQAFFAKRPGEELGSGSNFSGG